MAKVTSERFLELVERSKLVDAEQIAALTQSLREEHGGELPEDPVEVSKAMERAKMITRWHTEKLLQGKYRGFFLGKHKLLGHLGSGGMSTVYLAEHLIMHHRRAVKVMPKSKLGNNSYLRRFQQEAKAIAALNHPNIVRAFDVDNEGDTHFIVMEYVEGADIQTLVKRNGPLPFDQAADFARQAALGLQHAHDRGLIHRDVKPANLLVDKNNVVKVLDLGLALYADESESSLTMEHNDKVLGTADYLAPEQALNSHSVDFRADIYALGCTLYYMLTGHAPFPEGSIAQRIAKHQKMMPEEIKKDRPDCPGQLDGICVKMMQKDPRFRYASCQQVADVLDTWIKEYHAAGGVNSSKSQSVSETLVKARSDSPPKSVSERPAKGGSSSGGSKSNIISLAASDSGVLQRIAAASGSIVDSKIDLAHDSNDVNRRKRKAEDIAAKQAAAARRIAQVANNNSRLHDPTSRSRGRGRGNADVLPDAAPQPTSINAGLIAIGVGLLGIAMILGFLIAKLVG